MKNTLMFFTLFVILISCSEQSEPIIIEDKTKDDKIKVVSEEIKSKTIKKRWDEEKMVKLYKIDGDQKLYWETWETDDGWHTIHWGNLGDKGQDKEIEGENKVFKLMNQKIDEGYKNVDSKEHHILLVEYKIKGFGTKKDLKKRHDLEARLNETLGWTGLGHVDGGSIGSDTMEVCCFVVDFDLAKKVIEKDLKGTKYSNYIRIYKE